MTKQADPIIVGIRQELRYNNQDNNTYGRSDYRRGYGDGLRRALKIYKAEMKSKESK